MNEPKYEGKLFWEPWPDGDGASLLGEDREEFVRTYGGTANARRLAACWNACRHVPTATLETGIVSAMQPTALDNAPTAG